MRSVCRVPRVYNAASTVSGYAKAGMKKKLKIPSPGLFDCLLMLQQPPEPDYAPQAADGWRSGFQLLTGAGRWPRRDATARRWKNGTVAEDVGDAIAAAQPERKKMLEVARFVRVPGAQWKAAPAQASNWTMDGSRNTRSYEINKLGRENDRLIVHRLNRITVMFRPKDTVASEELADKLNGKFRADFTESSGGEAVDNCYADGIDGGFGAFRLSADLEATTQKTIKNRCASTLSMIRCRLSSSIPTRSSTTAAMRRGALNYSA